MAAADHEGRLERRHFSVTRSCTYEHGNILNGVQTSSRPDASHCCECPVAPTRGHAFTGVSCEMISYENENLVCCKTLQALLMVTELHAMQKISF